MRSDIADIINIALGRMSLCSAEDMTRPSTSRRYVSNDVTAWSGVCDVVDGRWTDWTDWSLCSKSCDSGIRSRSRDCTQPPPQHGGQVCTGVAMETIPCNDNPCPGR